MSSKFRDSDEEDNKKLQVEIHNLPESQILPKGRKTIEFEKKLGD